MKTHKTAINGYTIELTVAHTGEAVCTVSRGPYRAGLGTLVNTGLLVDNGGNGMPVAPRVIQRLTAWAVEFGFN